MIGILLAPSVAEKFEISPDGCWLWTAYLNPTGYGQVRINGRTRLAHRVVYESVVGPIPDGLELDHLCRIRACVNPEHLEPVTHAENMRRGDTPWIAQRYAERTHCGHGHPFDEANTYWAEGGRRRRCRACKAAINRRWYEARKAAA